jgi:hypothetical protein
MAMLGKIALLAITLTLTACGANYDETRIKNFRLFIETDDSDIINKFKGFSEIFNKEVGLIAASGEDRDAITIVDSPSEANSTAKIVLGLESEKDKIGFGRWETKTSEDAPVLSLTGGNPRRVVEYSMALEFDEAYILDRIQAPKNSEQWKEIFTLFCHEVGHGMTLVHTDDITDVMYPTINGKRQIDFEQHFENIRNFFIE